MIPKGHKLRDDAELIVLTTVQKSVVGGDHESRDAAMLMRDFVMDVIAEGEDADVAWVLLYASAGKIIRKLLADMSDDPDEQQRILEELRRETLLETV